MYLDKILLDWLGEGLVPGNGGDDLERMQFPC